MNHESPVLRTLRMKSPRKMVVKVGSKNDETAEIPPPHAILTDLVEVSSTVGLQLNTPPRDGPVPRDGQNSPPSGNFATFNRFHSLEIHEDIAYTKFGDFWKT